LPTKFENLQAGAPLARELLLRLRQFALQSPHPAEQRLRALDPVAQDETRRADHLPGVVNVR
jgi:hypothetical protein